MPPEMTLDVFQRTVYLIMVMAAVILIPGLLVGLLVAIFQAATQINEMSMTFVPKFMVTVLTMMFIGDWLLNLILTYTRELIVELPYMIG